MKLSTLLSQREALLRRARLANLAFAHATLSEFARRLARAGLHGRADLRPARPREDRFYATLLIDGASAAVIEEHFTEEYLTELIDVLAFVHPGAEEGWSITPEELTVGLLPVLRRELEAAGVELPAGSDHNTEWGTGRGRRRTG